MADDDHRQRLPVRRFLYIWLALIAGTVIGCSSPPAVNPVATPQDQFARYSDAIADSSIATPEEEVDTLIPIVKDSPDVQWRVINGEEHVLTVNWARESFGETPGESLAMPTDVWVSLPRELGDWCGTNFDCANSDESILTERMERLYGEPPNSGKKIFIEMWVPVSGLIRPCFDTRITTTTCPASDTNDAIARDSKFLWQQTVSAYSLPKDVQLGRGEYGWPWTRLGYTYDWASGSDHIGLSEYVIRAETVVEVAAVEPTQTYVRNLE